MIITTLLLIVNIIVIILFILLYYKISIEIKEVKKEYNRKYNEDLLNKLKESHADAWNVIDKPTPPKIHIMREDELE